MKNDLQKALSSLKQEITTNISSEAHKISMEIYKTAMDKIPNKIKDALNADINAKSITIEFGLIDCFRFYRTKKCVINEVEKQLTEMYKAVGFSSVDLLPVSICGCIFDPICNRLRIELHWK